MSPYCIIYGFNEDGVYAMYTKFLLDDDTKQLPFKYKKELKASILYNAVTGMIYWRGYKNDKEYKNYQEEDRKLVYVKDVFSELHDIFIKKVESSNYCQIITEEVITVLKNSLDYRHDLSTEYQYSFTVPTYWNPDFQEQMLRPLFIKAGLVNDTDSLVRLSFFTQLTSNFRYIFPGHTKSNLLRERQYIMCGYKIAGEKLIVDLDLFIATSSSLLNLKNDDFIPSVEKSLHFTIPLVSGLESGIKACVGNINTTAKPEEMEQLNMLLKRYKTHKLISNRESDNFKNLQSHRLFRQFLSPKQWDLFEVEISRLQSITLEDIHGEMFDIIKAAFSQQLSSLLRSDYRKTRVAILVSYDTQQTDSDSFIYEVLFDGLQVMLRELGEYPFNFNLMSIHGGVINMVNSANTMEGSVIQLKNKISSQYQDTNSTVVPVDNLYDSSKLLFTDETSLNVINIAIAFDVIESEFVLIGENKSVEYCTTFNGYNIRPLSEFFHQSTNYQRPLLRINNRMKELMGNIPPRNYGPSVKKLLDNPEILQTLSNAEEEQDDTNSRLTNVYQKECKDLFLATYLGYLLKLVMNKINENFGDSWKNKNTIRLISVEKKLLNDIFGSREELQKLLILGDFGDASKESDDMIVSIQGEDILQKIEQKLELGIGIKSKFLVVQLHHSYMELTLHHAVRALSLESSAISIVIMDKILISDDALDVLCKKLWHFISNNSIIGCGSFHEDEENYLNSLNNYRIIFPQLKRLVQEMFGSRGTTLQMDDAIHINIREECVCKLEFYFRDVVYVGLVSMIQDAAQNIVTAVEQTSLFGKYKIDFIIVTGNMFTLMHHSPLHKMYINLLQKEIEGRLRERKTFPIVCVLQESQSQLLKSTINEKSYLCDILNYGKNLSIAA